MMTREFWNDRFSAEDYAYGTQPNDFLADSVRFITPSGRVLCAAEGEGRNAVFLARNGFVVSAVDISPEGMKKAQRLASDSNVPIDYVISDLDHFDFGDKQWDAVVSIFGYIAPDAPSRKPVYDKIRKALRPNGVLILEAYHPRQLNYGTGGPKDVNQLITLDELKNTFAGEHIRHGAELERDVIEGRYHTGISFVTQLIYKA